MLLPGDPKGQPRDILVPTTAGAFQAVDGCAWRSSRIESLRRSRGTPPPAAGVGRGVECEDGGEAKGGERRGMCGIFRPCRHRLPGGVARGRTGSSVRAVLTLRGEHAQPARVVTNHDALLVSVLYGAQARPASVSRRTAGPCPLRGMRTAPVAHVEGARPAASVSPALAPARIRDHAAGGGPVVRRGPRAHRRARPRQRGSVGFPGGGERAGAGGGRERSGGGRR